MRAAGSRAACAALHRRLAARCLCPCESCLPRFHAPGVPISTSAPGSLGAGHLRQHAADLAEQLDAEGQAREQADDGADFWHEQALNIELRDGERLGLTVDGTLHVITAVATAATKEI